MSIKQPWLDLILQGRKTIEIRTWYPKKFTLPMDILLHAGKGIDTKSAKMLNITPDKARTGCILGVVTFAKIVAYPTIEQFNQDYQKHWNPPEWYTGKEFGFVFENIRASQKLFPYKGQLNFFEVE